MRLSRVVAENFRGLDRLDVRLKRNTVVIGESGSGKTALVDALGLALGFDGTDTGFAFVPTDFSDESEPIRIRLEFRANRDQKDIDGLNDGLEKAVFKDDNGRLMIAFGLTAKLQDSAAETTWWFEDGDGGRYDELAHDAILRAFRRAFPLLIVRSGFAFGNESLRDTEAAQPTESGSLDPALAARIRELYQTLLQTRTSEVVDERPEIYAQIGRFIERHIDAVPVWLRELSGPTRRRRGKNGDVLAGSAQRIGTLMVAGALVEARSRSRGGLTGSHAILAVEDPEAHIHPTVLAAVWELLLALDVQTLVTTNSESLLGEVPLWMIRRLERRGSEVRVFGLGRNTLNDEDLRRVSYHVRLRRGGALFARCWLLVEGETEFWLMPGIAPHCGYDLAVEGVECVEFAQCGLEPMIKLADDLGIRWHVLVDGDMAGRTYGRHGSALLRGRNEDERVTVLPAQDIENYLWKAGYADVYREVAWKHTKTPEGMRRTRAKSTIAKAVKKRSKPFLALEVLRVIDPGKGNPVPRLLENAVKQSVALARIAR